MRAACMHLLLQTQILEGFTPVLAALSGLGQPKLLTLVCDAYVNLLSCYLLAVRMQAQALWPTHAVASSVPECLASMSPLDPLSAILNSLTNPTAKSCLQHEQLEYSSANMSLHAKSVLVECYSYGQHYATDTLNRCIDSNTGTTQHSSNRLATGQTHIAYHFQLCLQVGLHQC